MLPLLSMWGVPVEGDDIMAMNAGWLSVLGWFLFVIVFMRLWGWIDGADEMERKRYQK